MTELTEQMRKDGWKRIDDIVNEPEGIYQIHIIGALKEHNLLFEKSKLMPHYGKDTPARFYFRRLVPVTSENEFGLSRADAEAIDKESELMFLSNTKALENAIACKEARARLRTQLKGKCNETK